MRRAFRPFGEPNNLAEEGAMEKIKRFNEPIIEITESDERNLWELDDEKVDFVVAFLSGLFVLLAIIALFMAGVLVGQNI